MTGDDIRAFRERWNLSQGELARRIGYHYSTISLWESDKRTIPDRVATLLATLERSLKRKKRRQPES